MKIIEVYEKFKISPNLQDHMLRVCGIVEYIQKHWIGEAVDWNLTKKIALLHDLGNIVKFDFDKHPEFLGEEQKNVEYWKGVQSEIIKKYGSDDHEAIKKMLNELGIDEKSKEIIFSKRFGNSVAVKNSDNWVLKIMYYADLRTLPNGIGSLEDRISDVKDRMPKYTTRPDFDSLVDSCRGIEKQLQPNLNVSVEEINDSNIALDKDFLTIRV